MLYTDMRVRMRNSVAQNLFAAGARTALVGRARVSWWWLVQVRRALVASQPELYNSKADKQWSGNVTLGVWNGS